MVPVPARSVALLAITLVLLVGAAGAAGVGPDERLHQLNPQIAGEDVPETDNTITRIVLAEDGTAIWTIQIRTRLEDDAAEADYRAFQERFAANRSRFVDGFAEGVTGIVSNAEAVTGRAMAAEGVVAETSIQSLPRRWGIVTYRFRWVGFAAVEGEAVVAGDVFEGGFFIAEGDVLEVVAPAGYGIAAAEPTPDEAGDGTVTWAGRVDFADRRPRVVAEPVETTPAGSSPDGEASPVPWPLIGGATLVVLLVLAGLGYRRFQGRPGQAAGSTDAATTAGESDDPVLADEDHVVRALEGAGGRMKQAEIAEALGWSRSKTSRVLSRMEEGGRIRKLQLGRENVIDLREDE